MSCLLIPVMNTMFTSGIISYRLFDMHAFSSCKVNRCKTELFQGHDPVLLTLFDLLISFV